MPLVAAPNVRELDFEAMLAPRGSSISGRPRFKNKEGLLLRNRLKEANRVRIVHKYPRTQLKYTLVTGFKIKRYDLVDAVKLACFDIQLTVGQLYLQAVANLETSTNDFILVKLRRFIRQNFFDP